MGWCLGCCFTGYLQVLGGAGRAGDTEAKIPIYCRCSGVGWDADSGAATGAETGCLCKPGADHAGAGNTNARAIRAGLALRAEQVPVVCGLEF